MNVLVASDTLRLNINSLDYGILAVYFAVVMRSMTPEPSPGS